MLAVGMARQAELRERFGQRVRELRRRRDLTLEELAERAKLSDKFLQAVETARQAPTVDAVEKIARGLNVLPAELFVVHEQSAKALRARARELIGEASDAEIEKVVRLLEAVLH
jgi:transcriptional regulator with XRE-family HTH domain